MIKNKYIESYLPKLTILIFSYFFGYSLFFEVITEYDSLEYIYLSNNFWEYIFFSVEEDRGLRLFLYPFLLYLTKFINLKFSIVLVNSLLLTMSFLMLQNLLNEKKQKTILFFLFIFSPNLIFYNLNGLAEILCFFSTTFTLFNAIKFNCKNNLINFCNFIFLFYTRPSLIPFVLVIFLVILSTKNLKKLFINILILVSVISPWSYRQNNLNFEFPTNHVNYVEAMQMATYDILQNKINSDNFNFFELLFDGESISKEFTKLNAEYLNQNIELSFIHDSKVYFLSYAYGIVQTLFGLSGYYLYKIFNINIEISNFIGGFYLLITYLFNLTYFLKRKKNTDKKYFIFLITCLTYLILNVGTFWASTRFRVPLEPFIIFYAIKGIERIEFVRRV